MNRRDFVVSAAAAAAWTSTAGGAARRDSSGDSGDLHPDLYTLVYDTRFAASRAYGVAARRRGAATTPIAGDVTALWYHDLHPRWSRGTGAIAGMTTSATLFCLEQLAADHRFRVLYRSSEPPHPVSRWRSRTAEGRYGEQPALLTWLIASPRMITT